jgi:hypothetical protein
LQLGQMVLTIGMLMLLSSQSLPWRFEMHGPWYGAGLSGALLPCCLHPAAPHGLHAGQ